MDADYAKNLDESGNPVSQFEHSLFVYSTVMSINATEKSIVDAGLKTMTFEAGMPGVPDFEGIEYERPSDEHGKLNLSQTNHRFALGDKVRLVPPHCDPTVNLHEWYVGVRNGVVESLWPIVARGAVY